MQTAYQSLSNTVCYKLGSSSDDFTSCITDNPLISVLDISLCPLETFFEIVSSLESRPNCLDTIMTLFISHTLNTTQSTSISTTDHFNRLLKMMPNVQCIVASHSILPHLPSHLSKLPKLKILILDSSTSLKSKDIPKMKHLEFLSAAGLSLTLDKMFFKKFPSLLSLSAATSTLFDIKLKHAKRLRYINLRYCNAPRCRIDLSTCPTLHTALFDCSSTTLVGRLPPSLRHLGIQGMQSIPKGTDKLESINLSSSPGLDASMLPDTITVAADNSPGIKLPPGCTVLGVIDSTTVSAPVRVPSRLPSPSPPAPAPLPSPAHDRLLAAALGAAVGDAMGLSTEFMAPGVARWICSLPPPPGLCGVDQRGSLPGGELQGCGVLVNGRDYHRSRWCLGDFTDDTDQGILIVRAAGADDSHQCFARALFSWSERGFPELGDIGGMGIGRTVGTALRHPDFCERPIEVSEGLKNPHGAANGAAMRTWGANLLALRRGIPVQEAADSFARVTHAEPRAVCAAVGVSAAIDYLARGGDGTGAASVLLTACSAGLSADEGGEGWVEELEAYATCAESLSDFPAAPRFIGYALLAAGCGAAALREDAPAKDTLLELCALGGDADTNGAVVGALLGARDGLEAILPLFKLIPPHLRMFILGELETAFPAVE